MHQLKDCRTGGPAPYATGLRIDDLGDRLRFRFEAAHSACYCPHDGYNQSHYEGDVCELFLGSSRDPAHYYEINLAPNNRLLFGRITYLGAAPSGSPIKQLQLLPERECFVSSRVERTPEGYIAEILLDKARLKLENGDIRFNAFRIETDGGEMEKHLLALKPTLQPRFHVPQCFVPLQEYLSL